MKWRIIFPRVFAYFWGNAKSKPSGAFEKRYFLIELKTKISSITTHLFSNFHNEFKKEKDQILKTDIAHRDYPDNLSFHEKNLSQCQDNHRTRRECL